MSDYPQYELFQKLINESSLVLATENIREEKENIRIANENIRKANETNRLNTVNVIQNDYNGLRKSMTTENILALRNMQVDYNSLKKIIISENQAAELQDQINGNNEIRKTQIYGIENIGVDLIDFKNDWVKGNFMPNETTDLDWVVTGNTLMPKSNQQYHKGTLALYKKAKVQDGEIGVTIKGYNLETTLDSWLGIVFRATSLNNCLMAAFNPKTKTINLLQFTDGVSQVLRTVAIQDIQTNINSTGLNISVKFYGKFFTIYVNGTPHINTTSSTFINSKSSLGFFGVGNNISGSISIGEIQNIEYSNIWVKKYAYNKIPQYLSKILCCGDSNMMGYGVEVGERWTTLLGNELVKQYPSIYIKNTGVGGKTTSQILNDQLIPNINNTYQVCIVLGGSNNARVDGVGTTVDSALEDMLHAIRYIKTMGVIPIICMPPIVDVTVDTKSYTMQSVLWLQEYRARLLNLCMIEDILTINFFDCMNNDISLLTSDKIHFNINGHQVMGGAAINVFKNEIDRYK